MKKEVRAKRIEGNTVVIDCPNVACGKEHFHGLGSPNWVYEGEKTAHCDPNLPTRENYIILRNKDIEPNTYRMHRESIDLTSWSSQRLNDWLEDRCDDNGDYS